MAAGDTVVARWAYFDAQERGLRAWQVAVSILLIGLVGPVGLVVYLVLSRATKTAA